MSVRKCIPWPDKRLRSKAADVSEITYEVCAVWTDLIDTMEAMPGVGDGREPDWCDAAARGFGRLKRTR